MICYSIRDLFFKEENSLFSALWKKLLACLLTREIYKLPPSLHWGLGHLLLNVSAFREVARCLKPTLSFSPSVHIPSVFINRSTSTSFWNKNRRKQCWLCNKFNQCLFSWFQGPPYLTQLVLFNILKVHQFSECIYTFVIEIFLGAAGLPVPCISSSRLPELVNVV